MSDIASPCRIGADNPFVFDEGKSPEAVIKAFVKAAREFAGISHDELANRIVSMPELNRSEPHVKDGFDIANLESNGRISDQAIRFNLETLIAVSRACGLNLKVAIALKTPANGHPSPAVFFKHDEVIESSAGNITRKVFAVRAGSLLKAVREAYCSDDMQRRLFAEQKIGISPSWLGALERGKSAGGHQFSLPRISTLLNFAQKADGTLSFVLHAPANTIPTDPA